MEIETQKLEAKGYIRVFIGLSICLCRQALKPLFWFYFSHVMVIRDIPYQAGMIFLSEKFYLEKGKGVRGEKREGWDREREEEIGKVLSVPLEEQQDTQMGWFLWWGILS